MYDDDDDDEDEIEDGEDEMKQSKEESVEDPLTLFKTAFQLGQDAMKLYYADDDDGEKDEVLLVSPLFVPIS